MNLWILSEERPKTNVLLTILKDILNYDTNIIDNIKILPIMTNKKFSFTYKLEGISIKKFDNIFIKIVKGESSFVDYIIFEKEKEPTINDIPIVLIEETKTDDTESRNVHTFQRNSKFVYGEFAYPGIRKVMLYTNELQHNQKHPTTTNIFGTKILLTLGVEIYGKNTSNAIYSKFKNYEELIKEKNDMPEPLSGQPIKLSIRNNNIYISAKLDKRKRQRQK